MLSDNAKTFQAADKAIKAILHDPAVQQHFVGLRVEWRFNLEKAPWQGGIFERMVKSAKRCLRKAIGKKTLTFDELLTLVVEVEAVLNSRPLSYISTEDLDEPLTPSHLITGHRILSLPDPTISDDPDYDPSPEDLTKRMGHLVETCAKFWRRWKREYLQELREHHRSHKIPPGVTSAIGEGEPVIVYDEGQPRGLWRLGRVMEVISSSDGHIRAARVKVLSPGGRPTILKRPIQHLYPLEVRVASSETGETVEQPSTRIEPPQSDVSRARRPCRRAAQQARDRVKELAVQNRV